MAIPQQLVGVKGDECQCGRRSSVRHCPLCGSSRIYGYSPAFVPVKELKCDCGASLSTDGLFRRVQEFKCMSCANKFTDDDREFCDAPPISKALALQKVRALHEAAKSGDYLLPHEQIALDAVNSMLPAEPLNKTNNSSDIPDEVLGKIDWSFRRAWADEAAKVGGPSKYSVTVKDFVMQKFREAGYPEAVLERVSRRFPEAQNG